MSLQIDQTTNAIKSQLQMIQQNRKHRNQIYQSCMDNYMAGLRKQIQQLESTSELNSQRNKSVSMAFENVYDKIMTSANITLRKIKQTSYQKKVFWDDLIKNNAALTNLELKKQFYIQKRDSEDRYYDAIEQQNNKKLPYAVLLGKNKKKQELKEWKQNNKLFEERVNKGTATLNQWKNTWDNKASTGYNPQGFIKIGDFMKSSDKVVKPSTNYDQKFVSGPKNNVLSNNSDSINNSNIDFGFLKNFEKKK